MLRPAVDVAMRIDLEPLDRLLADCGGDGEMVASFVDTYCRRMPHVLEEMRDAVRRADLADLGRHSHTLASTSAMVGAVEVAEAARSLETASDEGSSDGADTHIARIETSSIAAIAELEEIAVGLKNDSAVQAIADATHRRDR